MRFLYLRAPNGHPIGCIATELHRAAEGQRPMVDMVAFAISVCNPLDQFKREQAKALAAGRLSTGIPKRFFPIGKMAQPGTVKSGILNIIASSRDFPQRAREAARFMLANLNRGPKPVDPPPSHDEDRFHDEGNPNHPDPDPSVMAEVKRANGLDVKFSEGDCNCASGRKISGLKWHSTSTPGCILNAKGAS